MTSSISFSSINLSPFTKIGPDASMQALSFLDYPDLHSFFRTSHEALALRERNQQRLERTLFSRIEIFDRKKWEECWKVEITDQFDPRKIDILVLRDFLKIYYGPNPIDPSRLVKDTCLIPTVVPAKVNDKGKEWIFNLVVLKVLGQRPEQGQTEKLGQQSEKKHYHLAWYLDLDIQAISQSRRMGAEKDCLVILLQDVVGRGRSWSRESQNPDERGQTQVLRDVNTHTDYGCETEPDGLSQNTVLFAHHALTGKYPFGDKCGMEGRSTYGRTRELVRFGDQAYRMISGRFSADKVITFPGGSSIPCGMLKIDSAYYDAVSFGVGVLRKFPRNVALESGHRISPLRNVVRSAATFFRSVVNLFNPWRKNSLQS